MFSLFHRFRPREAAKCVRFRSKRRYIRKMDPSIPFEEERLPWYQPDQFYPVHIGQTLGFNYKVIGKLGYGANSTVWLCRDLRDADFVTVKVCTRTNEQSQHVHRDVDFYEHVSTLDTDHPGAHFIRQLYETFKITGPSGQHLCLVHPPMHMTIRELQYQSQSHILSEWLLKWTLSNILQALSFLHDEARVVHTDINWSNIMLAVADQSLLEEVERMESENPLPQKVIDGTRTIYSSHKLGRPKNGLWGQPVLCDFGEARIGERHNGIVQPELYRAPEVLFEMEWDSSVDIWSVATLVWDLFENKHLFDGKDKEGHTNATNLVAEMVAYIGLPPVQYLQRSEVAQCIFDEQGKWKPAGGTMIPQLSLEESITRVEGGDKEAFLSFIRSMLEWVPEKRKRASELLEHPWMIGARDL